MQIQSWLPNPRADWADAVQLAGEITTAEDAKFNELLMLKAQSLEQQMVPLIRINVEEQLVTQMS